MCGDVMHDAHASEFVHVHRRIGKRFPLVLTTSYTVDVSFLPKADDPAYSCQGEPLLSSLCKTSFRERSLALKLSKQQLGESVV